MISRFLYKSKGKSTSSLSECSRWLLLAAPGCSWLLGAASGPGLRWSRWVASRCGPAASWLLLAAPGCSRLRLVTVFVGPARLLPAAVPLRSGCLLGAPGCSGLLGAASVPLVLVGGQHVSTSSFSPWSPCRRLRRFDTNYRNGHAQLFLFDALVRMPFVLWTQKDLNRLRVPQGALQITEAEKKNHIPPNLLISLWLVL